MKITDERKEIEKLLNEAPDKIDSNVPVPGTPSDLQPESTLKVDFDELQTKCNIEATKMITNAVGYMLPIEIINNNEYLKNKMDVDILTLSGMLYQLRSNEAMQRCLMEEVKRGFLHPRMFEVFSGLSKTIGDLNKQTLQTVEAIKLTYSDIKKDYKEKQTELQSPQATGGELSASASGVVSFGTKELIKNVRKIKLEQEQEKSLIADVSILE